MPEYFFRSLKPKKIFEINIRPDDERSNNIKRRGFITLNGFLFLASFLQGCNMLGWGKNDLVQIA